MWAPSENGRRRGRRLGRGREFVGAGAGSWRRLGGGGLSPSGKVCSSPVLAPTAIVSLLAAVRACALLQRMTPLARTRPLVDLGVVAGEVSPANLALRRAAATVVLLLLLAAVCCAHPALL